MAGLDRLVHANAKSDALVFARHRSFIASHLAGAVLSFATFGVFFLTIGSPTTYALIALAWFACPLAVALVLSRSGGLDIAHFLSVANLVGLVTFAAALTGGIFSFAVVWMVIVPLEAALSSSRRVVIGSSLVAMAALAGLYEFTVLGWLPLPAVIDLGAGPIGGNAAREVFSHLAAAGYAGALALNIEGLYRQSETVIRAGHERFRLLAENATDLITRHDESGLVVFASPASLQIIGVNPDDLLGSGLLRHVVAEDRPRYQSALARAERADGAIEEEFRIIPHGAADGMEGARPQAVWVEMRCRPVAPHQGAVAGSAAHPRHVIAVTRDISQRKHQELELIEARNLAERASRAKTLLLANMSHELRTPLNAILGFSDLLTMDLGAKGASVRTLDHCRIIHESGEHLLNLVNDLLDVSKIESGNYTIFPEPFDLDRLIASCCETMRHAADAKAIALSIELPADLPELEADPRAVKQMVLNLLSNAVKFTAREGCVGVRVRADAVHYTIAITDNGIGIAPEDIPRLGQPFVQIDTAYSRRHEGTGLGLSVVNGLAKLHGGRLAIESALQKGTTMTIQLPLVAPETGLTAAPVHVPPIEPRAAPAVEHNLEPAYQPPDHAIYLPPLNRRVATLA